MNALPGGVPASVEYADALDAALVLAREAAAADEVPVGAVVVELASLKIIGRGRNRREHGHDPLGHAELLAMREAATHLGTWRLSGCAVVVTLEPCPMCLAACQQSRVDHVVYAAADPKGGALSLGYALHDDSQLNHRFKVSQIERPEAGEILSEFFRSKRNRA